MKKFLLAVIMAAVLLSSFGCEKVLTGYDSGYLEKKLILPYTITGSLTTIPLGVRSDGAQQEVYDVLISSGEYTSVGASNESPGVDLFGDFKIEFKSGEVTDGLTVEFFDEGVFISFDDLRFKTNSDLFTRLELIKDAFAQFARADVVKKQQDVEPVAGIDITEISADADGVEYRALVNKKDGSLIRLTAESNSEKLILDVKQFDTFPNSGGNASTENAEGASSAEGNESYPSEETDVFADDNALLVR